MAKATQRIEKAQAQVLRVLYVEDRSADVELSLAHLEKAGLKVKADVVDTPEAFQEKLSSESYDIVLSDYRLPNWTGMDALKMLHRHGKRIPFILVTGTMGDETAVECIKEGATDYVSKDHISRLPLVVRRALDEKASQRERRRAIDALRESEQRYRLLFERNLAGVFRSTPDGRILDCNESFARIFGFASRDEALSHSAWDLYFDPDDRKTLLARIKEQRTLANAHARLRRIDGNPLWVILSVSAAENEDGDPELLEGTLIDVTEHKRLEEQLRQAQKMEAIGQLAGGIAHDFNNLLTIITGYSQLLLARSAAGDPMRESVEEIKKAGDRAASLTRQLLAFSRQQVMAPQVVDLNAIVANLDKMLQRMIGEDIDLVIVREPGLGHVKADPGQIEQILLNLAVNSRDAIPEDGKITLQTSNVDVDEVYARSLADMTPGRYVLLAVSDNGCGMDEQTKAHIFEPFFTTKEKGKGTGLGLATVYGIVKQSGGHISVYSEPGWGTTFSIYLPRIDQPVEVAEPHRPRTIVPRGSETILLVEDEDAVRVLARGILESNGYKVLDARGGHEALLLCERHKGPVHLMLTDVMMPQMSGRELAHRIASLFPKMRLLYMSGYASDTVVKRGVLEPGAAFLNKPFTPYGLAWKVREVLDRPQGSRNSDEAAGMKP